jgi:hypothetical protein
VQRRAVRLAGQIRQAAHRLEDAREAGALGVRPGLAEAGDAQHNQPRIGGEQRVGVEAPALQRAGAEVLHQHVEVFDQLQEQRAPLGLAHVQRDAALAAVADLPVQRHAFLHRRQRAQRVAAVWQLQLHDLGAVVGAQRGRERRREHGGHVEDADARERAGMGRGGVGVVHQEGPKQLQRPDIRRSVRFTSTDVPHSETVGSNR